MLRTLSVRDMLLIDRLDLDFGPGLNVLTGETGAGKSILLDSLGFALGWRGRGDVVRPGADRAEVVAEFDLPPDHPARGLLEQADLPVDDVLILRRSARADGRKQAHVNDRRVTAETLRRLSATLVELHGQHDDRGLLNPAGHRALLDAFAGNADRLAACRAAWQALEQARADLDAARQALAAAEADRDFLTHAVQELATLAPEAGEEAALDARRRLMQAAARIREDIARAAQALGSEGAEGLMFDAARWLDGAAAAAEGRLDAPLAALSRAQDELAAAQRGVADCLEALDFDPQELERTEERLFAIRALARKHGVLPDDLPGLLDELQERLDALEGGAAGLAERERAVAAAERAHAAAAAALTRAREQAARRLDRAMAAELPPLKLDRARFETRLSPAPPGPEGAEAVQFTIATNPGTPPGPLNRIASGGELSRFLLALKLCLHAGGGATMIFDEIDRGVGGATAAAVGRRLADLARAGQVLVVTHSPQVAGFGRTHLRVEKRIEGDTTRTHVAPVTGRARVDEIARMLAGESVTEAARKAAEALIEAG